MVNSIVVPKKILLLVFLIVITIGFLAARQYLNRNTLPESVLSAQKAPDYVFVFLGDSMTEYLGNFDELRSYLKDYYPKTNFLLLNYGFGSTNVTSAIDRVEKDSTHSGRIFIPIKDIPFKYIFIESFGQNPLSQYPLEEGLKKQNEALDQLIASLTKNHPRESIIFVTTIAPNRDQFGKGVVDLSDSERQKWADERSAYMENHTAYAKAHNIPVIDIYQSSLNLGGTGNLIYINKQDYIHPSPKGLYLISKEIAKFIWEKKLITN